MLSARLALCNEVRRAFICIACAAVLGERAAVGVQSASASAYVKTSRLRFQRT